MINSQRICLRENNITLLWEGGREVTPWNEHLLKWFLLYNNGFKEQNIAYLDKFDEQIALINNVVVYVRIRQWHSIENNFKNKFTIMYWYQVVHCACIKTINNLSSKPVAIFVSGIEL